MKRRLLAALLVAASLVSVSPAFAGPPTDAVKAKQTALFDLLKKPDDAKNKTDVAAILDEMLDYAALTQASLGDQYAGLTEAQRAEFADLLKQLVRRSYERNLRKTLSFDIEYLAEEAGKDGKVRVKTRAVHKTDKREEPIQIDFEVTAKGGGKFAIADIRTEDVSLVESYRAQFTKIIKKDGFPALITKMKDKIAKGDV